MSDVRPWRMEEIEGKAVGFRRFERDEAPPLR